MKHHIFINDTILSKRTQAIIRISQLSSCGQDKKSEAVPFTVNYSLRTMLATCAYLDEQHGWQSDGIHVVV